MHKVVYNSCYGGFGLSAEAIELARKLSGNPRWGGALLKGEYAEGSSRPWVSNQPTTPLVKRHDPILIRVVEELGERANGYYSALKIAKLRGNRYRIDEYDGHESVIEPNDGEWTTIE